MKGGRGLGEEDDRGKDKLDEKKDGVEGSSGSAIWPQTKIYTPDNLKKREEAEVPVGLKQRSQLQMT